jgi:hypothetical protein
MRQPGRRAVGQHSQHLVTESRKQRGHRCQPGEQRGRQLTPLALPADVAVFDVPADPLAHQDGHLPVPARQHRLKVGTGVPPGARDDQRAEGSLQLAASPGQQRVGVVARHSERRGELVAVELADQAELDDVPLPRVQPVDRGPDQLRSRRPGWARPRPRPGRTAPSRPAAGGRTRSARPRRARGGAWPDPAGHAAWPWPRERCPAPRRQRRPARAGWNGSTSTAAWRTGRTPQRGRPGRRPRWLRQPRGPLCGNTVVRLVILVGPNAITECGKWTTSRYRHATGR